MVLDRLSNAHRYLTLHPLFAAAFEFLETAPLRTMPTGVHEIQGKELFAIVSEAKGSANKGEAKLEVHRKYIDIQYVIEGTDCMGWKDLADCAEPNDAYTSDRDAAFFPDSTNSWFEVPSGSFTIFYPNDAHAAMMTAETVRKVVLKVAVG